MSIDWSKYGIKDTGASVDFSQYVPKSSVDFSKYLSTPDPTQQPEQEQAKEQALQKNLKNQPFNALQSPLMQKVQQFEQSKPVQSTQPQPQTADTRNGVEKTLDYIFKDNP